MFGFLRSRVRYAAGCDISRAAAKMMAFSYDGAKQELSYLDHKSVTLPRLSDKLDGFLKALAELEAFLSNAAGRLGRRIENVLVSVPDSIIIADLHHFRFVRPNPEDAVSQRELTDLWARLEAEAGEKLLPQGVPPGAYRLMPAEPEYFSIDGYTIRGELSGRGREITIAALVSAWPDEFAEAVEDLRQKFPRTHFRILPEAAAIRDYIGIRTQADFSGVAVDIGAEDSTLLLFDKGVLHDCWSFPFGGNDVTQAIAKAFGVSFGDAETLKHQWSQAALLETAAKTANGAATRVIEFWKHEWGALLASEAETKVITPDICLIGGGSRLPIMVDALAEPEWLESFSSGHKIQVRLLSHKDEANPFSPSWPFAGGGDEVIFSLVSRMIQQAGRVPRG